MIAASGNDIFGFCFRLFMWIYVGGASLTIFFFSEHARIVQIPHRRRAKEMRATTNEVKKRGFSGLNSSKTYGYRSGVSMPILL